MIQAPWRGDDLFLRGAGAGRQTRQPFFRPQLSEPAPRRGTQLLALDRPEHTCPRALLRKLFTPNRWKENEEFMGTLADRMIDELVDLGEVEFC